MQQQTLVRQQVAADAVANRNKGRRGRSRKRRPKPHASLAEASGVDATTQTVPPEAGREGTGAPAAVPARARRQRARERNAAPARAETRFRAPQALGERPQAPWHPVPLSEVLILIGAIATAIGASKLSKGTSSGAPTLVVGVAAVLVGTVEFSLREHRSGYRSHTILLALLPTVVLYTGTLLVLAAFLSPVPVGLKVAPLALALPVFAFLFKLLRARFQDARRERVFAGARRR